MMVVGQQDISSMQQQQAADAWRQALADGREVQETLEALASYSLGTYQQHMALVQCPGLVEALVQQLSAADKQTNAADETPTTTTATTNTTAARLTALSPQQLECAEAALEVAVSLAISKEGLQALLRADAVAATCQLLQHIGAQQPSRRTCKLRRRTHDLDVTAAVSHAEEDDTLDLIALALQLLAVLLLSPCASRPAVGVALAPELAAATGSVLLEVLPVLWRLLSVKQQLDAAAVVMRLAMEPGVAEVLSAQAAAAMGDADSSTAHLVAAAPAGLGMLLGPQLSEDRFFASSWELQPALCRMSPKEEDLATITAAQHQEAPNQQQQQQQQQPQHPSTPAAQYLAQQLTASSIFDNLLAAPAAAHCPVSEPSGDPVEVLHKLHSARQLMQPLQLNSDLRLIKAQAAASTPTPPAPPDTQPAADRDPPSAPAPLQPELSMQQPRVSAVQQGGTQRPRSSRRSSNSSRGDDEGNGGVSSDVLLLPSLVQEVLWGPEGAGVTASDCMDALQDGFSLVLRDTPKRHVALGLLIEALEQQLGLPAGANVYLTPPGAQGLQAHYDDHDIFVLQLSGSKSWLLGSPQHRPLPLTYQQRLPVVQLQQQQPHAHQQPQQQPQQQESQPQQQESQPQPQHVMLRPGDCLYMPRGWVHEAVCAAEAAASPAAAPHDDAGSCASRCGAAPTPPDVDPFAGCSLHVSVGVEVDMLSSVQGFLHQLIDACAGTLRAGSCKDMATDQEFCKCQSTQQAHPSAAVQAAALLLHMQLWHDAANRPVYRKACPLLAVGSTAAVLSDAVLNQLQLAYSSGARHQPPSQVQEALASPRPASQPLGAAAPQASQHGQPTPRQLQHPQAQPPDQTPWQQWIAFAVQQLLQRQRRVLGMDASVRLAALNCELEFEQNSSSPLALAPEGHSCKSSADLLLPGVLSELTNTAAASAAAGAVGATAGGNSAEWGRQQQQQQQQQQERQEHQQEQHCCDLKRHLAAIRAATAGDLLSLSCWLDACAMDSSTHLVACATVNKGACLCCSQPQHVQEALTAVTCSMQCSECQSSARAAYVAAARAQLASCQAVRRGYWGSAALSQMLLLLQ